MQKNYILSVGDSITEHRNGSIRAIRKVKRVTKTQAVLENDTRLKRESYSHAYLRERNHHFKEIGGYTGYSFPSFTLTKEGDKETLKLQNKITTLRSSIVNSLDKIKVKLRHPEVKEDFVASMKTLDAALITFLSDIDKTDE